MVQYCLVKKRRKICKHAYCNILCRFDIITQATNVVSTLNLKIKYAIMFDVLYDIHLISDIVY